MRCGKRWEHSVLEPESVGSRVGGGFCHDTILLPNYIDCMTGWPVRDISTMCHVKKLCTCLLHSLLEMLY